MKIRLIPLVVLLTLLATACKEAPTRAGQELAQEFFAAWGDTTALKLVEAHYHAVDDSLWVPNSSMYLKKAFLETTGVNDSTRAVAQLMVYDKEQYAELQAFRILGENGQEEFVQYSNAKLKEQQLMGGLGMEPGYRKPVFDIEVRSQRETAYTKLSQNELSHSIQS